MIVDWLFYMYYLDDMLWGYVFNLFVELDYCGQGIVKYLMVVVEIVFKSCGVVYVVLIVIDMVWLIYEKNGWV